MVVLLDGGHTMPAVQTAFIKKRAHPFPNESRRPLFRPPALSGASGQSLLLRSDHSAASALARSACHASYRVLNSFWLQRLKDGHFPAKAIMAGTPATMQAASAMFKDELEEGTLTHIESPALDASATGSVKRDIGGNGGWGFGDGDGCMSIPVESAAGALYAGRTTKREPRRQQEANF